MKTTISRTGNSQGVIIPKPLLAQLGVEVGDTVEMKLENNALIIRKPLRPRYTAAELNAQCDLKAPMPDDLTEWDAMLPIEQEAL